MKKALLVLAMIALPLSAVTRHFLLCNPLSIPPEVIVAPGVSKGFKIGQPMQQLLDGDGDTSTALGDGCGNKWNTSTLNYDRDADFRTDIDSTIEFRELELLGAGAKPAYNTIKEDHSLFIKNSSTLVEPINGTQFTAWVFLDDMDTNQPAGDAVCDEAVGGTNFRCRKYQATE